MLYGYLYLLEFIAGEMREICEILVSLRNSLIAKRTTLKYKLRSTSPKRILHVLRVLYEEGYILSYYYSAIKKEIIIYNNYFKNVPTISVLNIFNKKAFPVYIRYTDLMTIHRFGIDLLLLSTSKGIMPHYKALKNHLGGKLICYIR